MAINDPTLTAPLPAAGTVAPVAPRPAVRAGATSGGRRLIGEILIMQGVITSKQLEQAHMQQKQGIHGKLPIGAVLVKLGFLSEEDITRARAVQMSSSKVSIGYAGPDQLGAANALGADVTGMIAPEIAMQNMLLPLGRTSDDKMVKIVSANWTQASYEAARSAANRANRGLEPLLGTERLIRPLIAQYYAKAAAASGVTMPPPVLNVAPAQPIGEISAVPVVVEEPEPPRQQPPVNANRASDVLSAARRTGQGVPGADSVSKPMFAEQDVDIQEFSVDQPVIIQFVNKIMVDAIRRRASDIHLEPLRDALEVKYRIDGALHSIDMVPKMYQNACCSRIKVMAELNIAERRVPQDGRISVTLHGRQVDLRVSSMPTSYGEAVVMRILDRSSMKLDIDKLGFSDRNLRALKNTIAKPHGIFLATGPTGSGKTTTLYAALQSIKAPDINIITVEDPIEYELDGVRQSSTNDKAGLTFARQLRAMLRQDPDVIYVGEIRDAETAEIAFRAALTGHLVFSTLHCNDAAGAVTRLLNMGVDPFLIASSVIGVLAQRLVRRVCPNCSQPYQPGGDELVALGIDLKSEEAHAATFRRGAGCAECDKSGYRGRYSVQELMLMDDSVRQLTLEQAPSTKIRQVAMASSGNPMIPMRRDGAEKVMQGITTAEEVQRRVFLEEE